MRRADRSPDPSFYVRVGGWLWTDRRNLWILCAGTCGFALGHGGIALAAGLLAQTLLGKEHAHGLPGVDPSTLLGLRSMADSAGWLAPVGLAFVGLAAAIVKAG